MKGLRLFGYYFLWHYGRAFADLLGASRNINWFLFHFFSIPLLLRTFFSPFERLHEEYGRGLDIGYALGSFVVNTLMRLVGVALRTFVIAAGVAVLVIAIAAELAFFVLWFFLPPAALFVFAWGWALVFSLA